ncbi:MAG: peroxidase family protein, partial [Verrucomicrobiota bacterium]
MTRTPHHHHPLCFVLLLTLGSAGVQADTRSLSGVGNNLRNPLWGSANQTLVRVAPACYADGISEPGGVDRPNPRLLSKALSSGTDSIPSRQGLSDLVWAWGQFLDHDITRIHQNPADAMPIGVHPPDPLSPAIPFFRSAFDPATGVDEDNPRQQINAISAFIDGSAVYGSDGEIHRHLRAFTGGRMLTSPDNLLPKNTESLPMDSAGDVALTDLFLAGDERANENPALLALHTLWVREHNFQANRLRNEHPLWDDETLFQQARRRVIG